MAENTPAEAPTTEMVLVQAFRGFKKHRTADAAKVLKAAIDAHLAKAYEEKRAELDKLYGKA